MANKIYAWNGSNWTGTNPKQIKAWNGSNWNTDVKFAKSWNGTGWATIWSKSDPIDVWAYPTWTYSYITASPYDDINTGTWINDDDLGQHYWNSYLGGNYIAGVMRFDLAAFGALGGRNVVKSASLRLTANTDYVADGLRPRIYQTTNAPATKQSTLNTGSGLSILYNDGDQLGVGVTNNVALHTSHVQNFVNGTSNWGLVVRNNVTDSEVNRTIWRGTFAGLSASTATRPRLDFTVDYV